MFVVLILTAGFFCLIAWARWSTHKKFEQARKILAEMSCPNCKSQFSEPVVASAEAAWKAHVAELRKTNPGMRFRLVCLWFVTCSNCGWKGDFSPSTFKLEPAADRAGDQ